MCSVRSIAARACYFWLDPKVTKNYSHERLKKINKLRINQVSRKASLPHRAFARQMGKTTDGKQLPYTAFRLRPTLLQIFPNVLSIAQGHRVLPISPEA